MTVGLSNPLSGEFESIGGCVPLIGQRWIIVYEPQGSFVPAASGTTEAEWLAAPSDGVQAVAIAHPGGMITQPFSFCPKDRILITGQDTYDPFGWGPKTGTQIANSRYDRCWESIKGRSVAGA